ncbi:MAG: tetratricopeptide repeat protein [Chloroflexota bacterium]|nr:tetratricopeptide repeat protein [Chloroflexota bacterium]
MSKTIEQIRTITGALVLPLVCVLLVAVGFIYGVRVNDTITVGLPWVTDSEDTPNPTVDVVDPASLYQLGFDYDLGNGVGRDRDEAFRLWMLAAEQGHAGAQVQLGSRYHSGTVIAKDLEASAYWFRQAADQGHPEGQYNLGIAYALGEGVPQNDDEAAMWIQRSLVQDFIPKWVKLEFDEAECSAFLDAASTVEWFKSNKTLCPHLPLDLTVELAREHYGRGEREDAERWFRDAANRGYSEAQFLLGVLLSGDTDRVSEGLDWIRQASTNGHEAARDALMPRERWLCYDYPSMNSESLRVIAERLGDFGTVEVTGVSQASRFEIVGLNRKWTFRDGALTVNPDHTARYAYTPFWCRQSAPK